MHFIYCTLNWDVQVVGLITGNVQEPYSHL